MTSRSGATKPVLTGSFSVDAKDLTSSSTELGTGSRRHSITNSSSRVKDTPVKADGSLRKVSRWFRDFKQKMDPIKVKDRIRYSRASLVPAEDVVNQVEANVFQRHGKTATIGPRRSSRKQLGKRFKSLDSIPATEKHRPPNIRKMNSFQFDALNDDELKNNSIQGLDLFNGVSQTDRLNELTSAISNQLSEREKLVKDFHLQSTFNQFRPSVASDVKTSLLASASLATELTHLINVSIRPENLHLQQQPPQPTTINNTATEIESQLNQPVRLFIDSSSNLIDIVSRLQYQLSTLLMTMDENSEKKSGLETKVTSTKASTESLDKQSLLPLPDPDSLTSLQESPCRHSSLSDSECFLSLINDLGDLPDDYEIENDCSSIPATTSFPVPSVTVYI